MALIWREARAAGISALGVTDHLNCHLNEAALRAARQEYDALTGKGSFFSGWRSAVCVATTWTNPSGLARRQASGGRRTGDRLTTS